MRFDLKRPCEACPFKEGQNYLRKARAEEIAKALETDQTFQCHKTVVHDGRGRNRRKEDNAQHCAGALIVLQKENKHYNNFMLRLAKMAGLYNEQEVDLTSNVVNTLQEFVKQHDG